ncbi:MAG TPA: hypothetical protein VFD01_17480 [Candidatus Dormibacteraeota bacterium]|jgi:hypothetical protein|nr:hypothetical protein [Candidatus Dormibacteraeota bacterium]
MAGHRFDRLAGHLARGLLATLAWWVGRPGREWLEAMRRELPELPGGRAQLRWALGGLRAAPALRRMRARRPELGWGRFVVHTLLGAPRPPEPRLPDPRPEPWPARGAFGLALLAAFLAGGAVAALRGLLEDSPYRFNAGVGAPAGIHPDLANPLSLAWDGVVLASTVELAAVLAAALLFLRLALDPSARRRWRHLRTALVAVATLLWLVLSAAVLWGAIAHLSAPALFDRPPRGEYLTWRSWLAIVLVLTAAALTASGAILRLPGRGAPPRSG